jgi:hypothetical protein
MNHINGTCLFFRTFQVINALCGGMELVKKRNILWSRDLDKAQDGSELDIRRGTSIREDLESYGDTNGSPA